MKEKPKQYLYHRVPEGMRPNEEGKDILYPLNMLKEKFPDLYELKSGKYDGRQYVPDIMIPTLENAAWGDVIQLTAIHPDDLKKALIEAGLSPKELKFYQIDPDILDPEKTTIFLYKDSIEDQSHENFAEYDPKKLENYSTVPEATRKHYKERFEQKKKPFLFVGVPHIFHKGPIDVSNFPVITAQ